MPTNFSALDQNLPRFTGEESVDRKVQVIQDYRPFEEEEDTMTGKEIYEALQEYTAKLPLPDWARAELEEAKRLGITDGENPMQMVPRYQAAIMAKRAVEAAK